MEQWINLPEVHKADLWRALFTPYLSTELKQAAREELQRRGLYEPIEGIPAVVEEEV
jgi:hypothetical protein